MNANRQAAECWKAEADTLRRIVLDALAEYEALGWQPIDSAPKDGTRVLLCTAEWPEEACVGWWMMDQWRDYGDIGCNGQEDYEPSHWMAVPFKPPEQPARHPDPTHWTNRARKAFGIEEGAKL